MAPKKPGPESVDAIVASLGQLQRGQLHMHANSCGARNFQGPEADIQWKKLFKLIQLTGREEDKTRLFIWKFFIDSEANMPSEMIPEGLYAAVLKEAFGGDNSFCLTIQHECPTCPDTCKDLNKNDHMKAISFSYWTLRASFKVHEIGKPEIPSTQYLDGVFVQGLDYSYRRIIHCYNDSERIMRRRARGLDHDKPAPDGMMNVMTIVLAFFEEFRPWLILGMNADISCYVLCKTCAVDATRFFNTASKVSKWLEKRNRLSKKELDVDRLLRKLSSAERNPDIQGVLYQLEHDPVKKFKLPELPPYKDPSIELKFPWGDSVRQFHSNLDTFRAIFPFNRFMETGLNESEREQFARIVANDAYLFQVLLGGVALANKRPPQEVQNPPMEVPAGAGKNWRKNQKKREKARNAAQESDAEHCEASSQMGAMQEQSDDGTCTEQAPESTAQAFEEEYDFREYFNFSKEDLIRLAPFLPPSFTEVQYDYSKLGADGLPAITTVNDFTLPKSLFSEITKQIAICAGLLEGDGDARGEKIVFGKFPRDLKDAGDLTDADIAVVCKALASKEVRAVMEKKGFPLPPLPEGVKNWDGTRCKCRDCGGESLEDMPKTIEALIRARHRHRIKYYRPQDIFLPEFEKNYPGTLESERFMAARLDRASKALGETEEQRERCCERCAAGDFDWADKEVELDYVARTIYKIAEKKLGLDMMVCERVRKTNTPATENVAPTQKQVQKPSTPVSAKPAMHPQQTQSKILHDKKPAQPIAQPSPQAKVSQPAQNPKIPGQTVLQPKVSNQNTTGQPVQTPAIQHIVPQNTNAQHNLTPVAQASAPQPRGAMSNQNSNSPAIMQLGGVGLVASPTQTLLGPFRVKIDAESRKAINELLAKVPEKLHEERKVHALALRILNGAMMGRPTKKAEQLVGVSDAEKETYAKSYKLASEIYGRLNDAYKKVMGKDIHVVRAEQGAAAAATGESPAPANPTPVNPDDVVWLCYPFQMPRLVPTGTPANAKAVSGRSPATHAPPTTTAAAGLGPNPPAVTSSVPGATAVRPPVNNTPPTAGKTPHHAPAAPTTSAPAPAPTAGPSTTAPATHPEPIPANLNTLAPVGGNRKQRRAKQFKKRH